MKNRSILVTALFLLPTALLHGLGIRVPDQDAYATAHGGAFAATADRPSAIYFNPAGITQIEGTQSSSGFYNIYLGSEYRGHGTEFDTKSEIQPVPSFFLTHKFKESPIAVGLGLYSPYGLALKWPDNSSFDTIIQRGRITYITANPVAAWEITPGLSIAAGLTLNYADTDIRRKVFLPIPGGGLLPAKFKFAGNDTDVGYTAGIFWRAHEKHSFGLSYHSATEQRFGGHTTVFMPEPLTDLRDTAHAQFHFPQFIIAGYAFRPTPDWNLEFNIDWTDWDSLDAVTLHQHHALPATITLPFYWQSSFIYQWGVTRFLKNGWSVSGGYIYSENSVPEAHFSPAVPDSERHIFSVGAGHKGRKWTWDLAYQFSYGPPRNVSGSPTSVFGQNADGRYEYQSHAVFLNLGYAF